MGVPVHELYPGDIKSVLVSEEQIRERTCALGADLGRDYAELAEDLLLVTVLKGAVMFVTDLARAIPVPTQLESPQASVDAFEQYVRQLCPGDPPCFDVMLLGLGDDGHTASLFPGTAATRERQRAVTIGAGKGMERISLTAPVLSAARQVIFLVSGAAKRQALQRLLDPAESAERTPARLVQPRSPVLVLADADAAAGC